MSLRARLTASFAVVLAIPLLVAAIVVRGSVVRQTHAAERADLRSGFSAAVAVYESVGQRDETAVASIAKTLAARPDVDRLFASDDASSLAASQLRATLGILALVRPDGAVAGLAAADPSFLPGVDPPPLARIVTGRPNAWATLSEVRVGVACGAGCTRLVGSVVGGTWLDDAFVDGLHLSPVQLTILAAGTPTASTVLASQEERVQLSRRGDLATGQIAGKDVVAVRGPLAAGVPSLELVASEPPQHSGLAVALALAAMMLLALIAGSTLAYFLARMHTKPIADLSAAAIAVAHGDFARRIEPRTHDEIGQLTEAFNAMTANLQAQVGELQASRDEIRRSVGRLGQTLQSTHDLTRLLSVVLETALAAVHGSGGAVFLTGATRQDLYVKVGRNVRIEGRARIPLGEGIAGWVARERRPILIPGADRAPHPAEPRESTVICVPLESQGQVIGAMALYGRTQSTPFSEGDLDAIASLAHQAAIGVENVLLHEEAQRLSITDGLTGAWNYRYFQMRLAQEVERAIRFARPFSMMVIDIDHFKRVNDTFGHQRGDTILIEVARRLVAQIRAQVDTLARYGGEEFVLILPETPLDGAVVVAEKILESVAGEPFGGEGEEPVRISVSIGLATFPEHGSTSRVLVRAADQAMYEAKARGRNRLVTADELDRTAAAEPPAPSGAPPVAGGSTETIYLSEPGKDSTPPPERP